MGCSSWFPQVSSFIGSGMLSPFINALAPSSDVPTLQSFESLGTSDMGQGNSIGSGNPVGTAGFNWTDEILGTEKAGIGGGGAQSQVGKSMDQVGLMYGSSGLSALGTAVSPWLSSLFGSGADIATDVGADTASKAANIARYASGESGVGSALTSEAATNMLGYGGEAEGLGSSLTNSDLLAAYGTDYGGSTPDLMSETGGIGNFGMPSFSTDPSLGFDSGQGMFGQSVSGDPSLMGTGTGELGTGTVGGETSWWDALKKFGGKNKLPLGMMGMGLLANTLEQPRQNQAIANSLQDYFSQKWTPESRASMMQGVMGQGASETAAAKRKLGSAAAATGRGGGMYGSSVERTQQAERESAATALSKTFAPTNFDANAYINLAKAQTGSNWWDSLLSGLGQTGGQWPYAMLMNMYGGG